MRRIAAINHRHYCSFIHLQLFSNRGYRLFVAIFRKSALRLHPDKQAGKSEEEKKVAETKFKAVNEAYEVLSNPEKKGRYDQGIEVEDLDNPNAGPGGGGGGFGPRGPGGIDPHVFFQHFMQQQGGGRAFGGRF